MISQFQINSLIINEDFSERIDKIKQTKTNICNEIIVTSDIRENSLDISELSETQLTKLLNGLSKFSTSYNEQSLK